MIADIYRCRAKYGLAVSAHLIKTFGPVTSGYDIGCKAGKTVRSHPILGPLARKHRFRTIVGSFHGAGHRRSCQLRNLPLYVNGVGAESFEGCEAFFSKSNALAGSTRYASRFHRQQAIVKYLEHADVYDAYAGLCKSLMVISMVPLICWLQRRF